MFWKVGRARDEIALRKWSGGTAYFAHRPVTLQNFSHLLEKCVGHCLKLLDIVLKNWDPLRKPFAPPGVLSWLRACLCTLEEAWLQKMRFVSSNFFTHSINQG